MTDANLRFPAVFSWTSARVTPGHLRDIWPENLGAPKSCFKAGGLQFLCGNALLHPFAFCGLKQGNARTHKNRIAKLNKEMPELTKIASQNCGDHGGRKRARNHSARNRRAFRSASSKKIAIAGSDCVWVTLKNRRKLAATTAASRRSRAISRPQRPRDAKDRSLNFSKGANIRMYAPQCLCVCVFLCVCVCPSPPPTPTSMSSALCEQNAPPHPHMNPTPVHASGP